MTDKLLQPSMPNQVRAYQRRWLMIAFAALVLDIITKAGVSALMPYGQSVPMTGFFNLVHTWNTGAAFSFLADGGGWQRYFRSEEHTSELQSLMRISYAVFCLKKKKKTHTITNNKHDTI